MQRLSEHRVITGWINVQLLHYTQSAPTCASAQEYLFPHEDSTQSAFSSRKRTIHSSPHHSRFNLSAVMTFSTGGKARVITERTRSQIKVAGMSSPQGGCSLPSEMSEKFSHLEETQNRSSAPEQRNGSADAVQAPGLDATRAGDPN